MKLTATMDRWAAAQNLDRDEKQREFDRLQAAKHAQDVYRVVAMMTMDERDRADEVATSLLETEAFRFAAESWHNHFSDTPIPIVQQLNSKWQGGDVATIRGVLSGWFD